MDVGAIHPLLRHSMALVSARSWRAGKTEHTPTAGAIQTGFEPDADRRLHFPGTSTI